MTGQVKMFTSLVDDAGDHEQVSFGDNSKIRISGLGEISLTNDLSLSNVLFVDYCSYNLLSIAQFCDLGLSCTFDDEGVTITNKKSNEVVFKGFRYGNLYLVDFTSREANLTTCLISTTSGLAMASSHCTHRHEPTQESFQERHGPWCEGCYF
jgi:hypothetical protein